MTNDLLTMVSSAIRHLQPPLAVIAAAETDSFDDAVVELRDGRVSWRVIRERSVLGLVAAPEFDRSVWFDVELLKRLFGHPGPPRGQLGRGPVGALPELLMRSLQDVISDLEELRSAVAIAFEESVWMTTRRQLNDLGRRRDAELFGRQSSSGQDPSPS